MRVLIGGSFRRWLDYGGGIFMNEISALTKETSPLPPCEDTKRRCQLWSRKWVLTWKCDLTGTLILGFQPPELWEMNFFVCKLPSWWCFVIAVPTKIVPFLPQVFISRAFLCKYLATGHSLVLILSFCSQSLFWWLVLCPSHHTGTWSSSDFDLNVAAIAILVSIYLRELSNTG